MTPIERSVLLYGLKLSPDFVPFLEQRELDDKVRLAQRARALATVDFYRERYGPFLYITVYGQVFKTG